MYNISKSSQSKLQIVMVAASYAAGLLVVIGLLAPSCNAQGYRNVLYAGETLQPRESLTSQNYSLTMQPDCNLVLYHGHLAMWSSQTHGRDQNCFARLRRDGNLVVYNLRADPLWSSNSWTREGNLALVLQKDGNAVIYDRPRWEQGSFLPISTNFSVSPEPTNILYPGETLKATESLKWGSFQFKMQTDCNLVLYDYTNALWQTRTSGTGCNLAMETDGSLSVYDHRNTRLWGAYFEGPVGKYVLILTKHRKIAVYGTDIWSTNWDGVESSKGNISMMTN